VRLRPYAKGGRPSYSVSRLPLSSPKAGKWADLDLGGTEARALRVPASMPPGCRPLGGVLPLPDRSATLADSFSLLPVSNDGERGTRTPEVLGAALTIGPPGRATRWTSRALSLRSAGRTRGGAAGADGCGSADASEQADET
jgi:hypothetical protein